jgi:mono/diheme cytochrome c family protein
MVLTDPSRRAVAGLIVGAAILGLVIASCSTTDRSSRPVARDSSLDRPADPPGTRGESESSSAGAEEGEKLFDTLGCMGCHVVNGKGGQAGPDLSNEAGKGRSRQWLQTQIRNPKTNDPQTIMPAYGNLSDQQVNSLVDYLMSLTTAGGQTGGAAAKTPRNRPTASVSPPSYVTSGGMMWSQRCGQCHNLRPPSEYSDAQWAVAVHHMRVRVPLTGEEQRAILAFLQASN